MSIRTLIVLSCALMLAGCDGSGSSAQDAGPDASDPDAGEDGGNEDRAFVFEVDPVSTPEPLEVILENVAKDAQGKLTSAVDGHDIRKLMVHTCLDNGATNSSPGFGTQRICTLEQLANKEVKGDFAYQDWENDVAGSFDPDNIHSEVNLYYHANKIYEFITSPEVGAFAHLPGRHEADGQMVPLHLIANYQSPAPENAQSLSPSSVASFITDEHLQMGMTFFMGLEGIRGDVLVFGQGPNMDFAYSGETVYHEFGHAIVNATADTGTVHTDSFGVTNQARTFDEGIANTFGFLISGEDDLGEYLSEVSGMNFTFHADNDAVVPDDLTGHPVSDGNAILGANREILDIFIGGGRSKADFTRILLLTLEDMQLPDGNNTYAQYAQAFEDLMAAQGMDDLLADVDQVFGDRGLKGYPRAKELCHGCNSRVLVGGAENAPWNTTLNIQSPEHWGIVSTSYLQLSLTVPQGVTQLTLTGILSETGNSMFSSPDEWDMLALARTGQPVEIQYPGDGTAAAVFDAQAPMVQNGDSVSWTLNGLSEGQIVYMLVVNKGNSEAWLSGIDGY